MNAHEYRFTWNGDEYRVVIAGDVVSMPGHAGAPGWSMGGFGASISEEWLLHEGRLPGTRAKQRALIHMIQSALASAHAERAHRASLADAPKGPYERCRACAGSPVSGFVPVAAAQRADGAVPCTLCGTSVPLAERVVGQASGPRGVILHDGEVAHAACLEAARA